MSQSQIPPNRQKRMATVAASEATYRVSAWDRARKIVLIVARYAIVLLLVGIGLLKWTHDEAVSIQNWVAHSPFLSWSYRVFDLDGASRMIGLIELAIATLIALRRISPLACFIGSLGAVGMFMTTLSFLVTTPGAWTTTSGIPTPTAESWFLVKDILLLGTSLWSAREAWDAAQQRRTTSPTRLTTTGKAS